MIKKILLALLFLFVVIQFIHPEKNISDDRTYDITTKFEIPQNVNAILEVACNDCHSNKTRYPWYSYIQPVDWWMADHVKEGKKELNFSEFTKRRIAVQNHKFEEIVEMVRDKEMPLASYTWMGLHGDANLTDEQRSVIVNWATAQMDSLKKWYPADSLVRRKR